MQIENLVFGSDFVKVKKEYLEDVATDYKIGTDPNAFHIAIELWRLASNDNRTKKHIVEKLKPVIFAGNTSVTWYKFPNARERINLANMAELSKTIIVPDNEEVTTEPHFLGGVEFEKDIILLRFMLRTGTQSIVSGPTVEETPKISIINVFISLINEYIEVRSDSRTAKKIIDCLLKNELVSEKAAMTRFEDYTEENLDTWVNELDGKLIEAVSNPERLFDEVTPEQVASILSVVNAINEYFAEQNITNLARSLDELESQFGDLSNIPFAALVIAGMDKIGLGTLNEDLRDQTLFSIIRPHVKYLRGFVQFPIVENGVKEEYTIRVGMTTKSVYFNSAATEKVIAVVRNMLLGISGEVKEEAVTA